MALRPDIQGIIYDLDNTLYRKPLENNDIFAQSAARSALNLGFRSTYEDALTIARKSGEQYKDERAVFWRDHGIDEKEMFCDAHRVGVELMKQVVPQDRELSTAFNAIAAQVKEVLILSHASQTWVDRFVEHLGYAPALKPGRTFGLDHPQVAYRMKDAGPEVFNMAASVMGLRPDQIAVVEDTIPNLVHAHALGMQTFFVNWGNPLQELPAHVHAQVPSIKALVRP